MVVPPFRHQRVIPGLSCHFCEYMPQFGSSPKQDVPLNLLPHGTLLALQALHSRAEEKYRLIFHWEMSYWKLRTVFVVLLMIAVPLQGTIIPEWKWPAPFVSKPLLKLVIFNSSEPALVCKGSCWPGPVVHPFLSPPSDLNGPSAVHPHRLLYDPWQTSRLIVCEGVFVLLCNAALRLCCLGVFPCRPQYPSSVTERWASSSLLLYLHVCLPLFLQCLPHVYYCWPLLPCIRHISVYTEPPVLSPHFAFTPERAVNKGQGATVRNMLLL